MCTMIATKTPIQGSGKSPEGWFNLNQVDVSFDHPFHAPYEHALNLDFVNEALGPGARTAVELSPESARQLAHLILDVLARAEARGFLE